MVLLEAKDGGYAPLGVILWRYDKSAESLVAALFIRACSSEAAKGLLMVLAKASEQVRAHDLLLCEGLIDKINGATPLCFFGMRGGVLILWGKVFNMGLYRNRIHITLRKKS